MKCYGSRTAGNCGIGCVSYDSNTEIKGHPGAICMVMQTAGSNANEISTNIDNLTKRDKPAVTKGVVLTDLMSTKDFLDASISEM